MSLRDRLGLILSVKGSPGEIALAFAVGLFIGFSPLLGLHTVLAIFFAFLFRMNKLVTLMGSYMINPWTIIPAYTFCTWFGIKLTGDGKTSAYVNFKEIDMSNILTALKGLLLPFVVGTLTVGLVASVISYLLIYHFLKKLRGRAG